MLYYSQRRGSTGRPQEPREHEMAVRISKKACNDAAELIGAIFYGRNELTCDGKVHVRYKGVRHTFNRNCDALDWMLDIIDAKLEEELAALGF